ncbi:hypothetical protein MBLNU457_g0528t1 [Dothideomycetes sp. NU457]
MESIQKIVENFYSRQFRPSLLDGIEDIEDYVPGGFCPVHLGDTFAHRRYRVIHKLGVGGFSTVWLARDDVGQRYVSLKILRAEDSEDCNELQIQEHLRSRTDSHPGRAHVALLVDHFTVVSPNGSHTALVYTLAGPTLTKMYSRNGEVRGNRRFRGDLARKTALQTAQALDFVHKSGVVHGDLTASNVLLKLAPIDNFSEDDIYRWLGTPIKEDLFCLTDSDHPNSAPQYVVACAQLTKVDQSLLNGDITIIDFGEAFKEDSPPADGVGTPAGYKAPELFFDEPPSKQSDIWALACTLFEIRAGSQLFAGYFGTEDEALENMVKTLGNLPEPWHGRWIEDYDPAEDVIAGSLPLRFQIQDIGVDDKINEYEPDDRYTSDLLERPRTTLSDDEIILLEDLLSKLLMYRPDQRRSVEWVCEHPWFQYTS